LISITHFIYYRRKKECIIFVFYICMISAFKSEGYEEGATDDDEGKPWKKWVSNSATP
jgi:hypothetical protein